MTGKSEQKSVEYQRGYAAGYADALRGTPSGGGGEVVGLNDAAWRDWVAFRRKLGKRPYKTNATAKWLAQYTESEQARIVGRSIAREWQGLYPLPAEEKDKPGQAPENLL